MSFTLHLVSGFPFLLFWVLHLLLPCWLLLCSVSASWCPSFTKKNVCCCCSFWFQFCWFLFCCICASCCPSFTKKTDVAVVSGSSSIGSCYALRFVLPVGLPLQKIECCYSFWFQFCGITIVHHYFGLHQDPLDTLLCQLIGSLSLNSFL